MSPSFWLPFGRRDLTILSLGVSTLAFAIRAGINLILLLMRLQRTERYGAR